MKKLVLSLIMLITAANAATAIQADTTNWISNPEVADISAFEIDLKSDLKNDFRYYQVTLTNKTNETVDIDVTTNKKANDGVKKLLNEHMTFKELMEVPKEIAVESYKEDVGTGNIAKVHKGLIYVTATAGAVAAGVGLLGVYPQQKTEEFFAHKKIKKEYKKISENLISEFTMAPMEQRDIMLLVPIDEMTPFMNIHSRQDENDVYSEYHQL